MHDARRVDLVELDAAPQGVLGERRDGLARPGLTGDRHRRSGVADAGVLGQEEARQQRVDAQQAFARQRDQVGAAACR